MSDYIKREDAIEAIAQREISGVLTVSGVYPIISDVPTSDVVEVVRCKDCKFYYNGRTQCLIHDSTGYRPDDYCSYGERADT